MPSAISAPDFGAFTQSEKQALLTAIKAELLRRAGKGRVVSGGSEGEQFNMTQMSVAELTVWLNGLTTELGYQQPEIRVAPDFSGRGYPLCGYGSSAVKSASRIEPNVGSWADLQALSTTGMPDNTIKIFVETDTGETKCARLLPSTAATDPSSGIYRPNDYSDVGNARCWFQSAL